MKGKTKRDPLSSKERVLKAALAEFSKKGLAGARVDKIARACGVNKQLLYYYFGNKEGMYRAVLADMHKRNEQLLLSSPSEFEASLLFWQQFYLDDPHYIRLMMWEALDFGNREVPGEEDRRKIYSLSLEKQAAECNPGTWPSGLSPEHGMITWIAIVAFPAVFPQICRLITGMPLNSPAFRAKRSAFLRDFAKELLAGDIAPKKGK